MDNRSRRIVYVSHCLLNTNVMAQGLGSVNRFPSLITPVAQLLLGSNVSIVQMPCPEKDILGLVREKRNRDEIPEKAIKVRVDKLVKSISLEIEDYIKNDFKVLAIIGKRGSPTCGVKEYWVSKGKLSSEPGFLMEELMKELERKGIQISFVDFEKDEESTSIETIKKLLNS